MPSNFDLNLPYTLSKGSYKDTHKDTHSHTAVSISKLLTLFSFLNKS